MTLRRPMSAVDRIPQRRFVMVVATPSQPSRELPQLPLDTAGRHVEVESVTTFGREEHKTRDDAAGGELGQRSETVRRSNLSAIVRELHVGGPRRARSWSPARA